MGDRLTVGLDERQEFTVAGQPKIGVQRAGRGRAVLSRGKHDQVIVGGERHLGHLPLGEMVCFVG